MNPYRRSVGLWLGVIGLSLLLAACAGSGEGLDAEGNPLDDDGPPPEDTLPFTPTFSSIQANIFIPFCVCHTGASAPQGLVLNTGAAFNQLVNTASSEVPQLLRVEPGNPDASYLIRKLEGGPDIVGFQMPPTELGEAHRPQDEIEVIRQWIADGALNN